MDERLRQHGTEIVPGDRPGGPSTSQTIMVSSLSALLALLPPAASADSYRLAVLDDNVLGKRTTGAREWAFRQLRRFYVLDPASLLFRALRDLWPDSERDRPLLAMLCAMARDPVLRASARMVLASDVDAVVGPDDFEKTIEEIFPGAYRASTRRATAQKLASSWQQSGHLDSQTPSRKVRARATSSPSAVASFPGPTVPWFWDSDVRIAIAPGLTCFEAGKEYEHGGVSPQECIVPRLTVTTSAATAATGGPEITKVTWLGLQCRIELSGVGDGVVADLRGLTADPNTSVAAKAKETTAPGRVSLIVSDEDLEGQTAHLVLVGPHGQILADRDVIVGRNR